MTCTHPSAYVVKYKYSQNRCELQIGQLSKQKPNPHGVCDGSALRSWTHSQCGQLMQWLNDESSFHNTSFTVMVIMTVQAIAASAKCLYYGVTI